VSRSKSSGGLHVYNPDVMVEGYRLERPRCLRQIVCSNIGVVGSNPTRCLRMFILCLRCLPLMIQLITDQYRADNLSTSVIFATANKVN
jgi:hypothetical protein